MKAVGIVGSPRKNGNTEILTRHSLDALAEEGFQSELIRLAECDIRPCNACYVCWEGGEECSIEDDLMPVYRKMKESDVILIATPVFFGSATALTRAFVERSGLLAYRNKVFTGKVGGPLVVARRAGKHFTFAELMSWFQIMGILMPGSTYWNVAIGEGKGEVTEDEEGINMAWNLGKNIASLVKKLKA